MYKNFKDMDAETLHKMSWEVVEVFDSYLSGLGVMIPCDDFSEQKEREEEYWNLVDGIEMWFTLYPLLTQVYPKRFMAAFDTLLDSKGMSRYKPQGKQRKTMKSKIDKLLKEEEDAA